MKSKNTKRILESNVQGLFAQRTIGLLKNPHKTGNFFHYRQAISILGLKNNQVFEDGRLDLNPDKWADFGPLNLHIGPPKSVIRYLKDKVNSRNITYYSPNLITSLRDAAAERFFKRKCSKEFEVIATEGVQSGLAYTILTLVNPGDEVIITDPGYFFLEPPIVMAGGRTKRLVLNKKNNYRMDIASLKKTLSSRTKIIIVCDPINPFGTVQTKEELIKIIQLANRRNIIIINNITHSLHQLKPQIRHYPMSSLQDVNLKNVIVISGVSHGYGMAGIRIGFLGGSPELLKAILSTKSAITRININLLAQYAALAAIKNEQYLKGCDFLLKRNFRLLKEVVEETPPLSFVIEPSYGFFACIDTSKIKATCQELTVALLKRRCAVYPSDGLGDIGATSYIRINFSTPDKRHFQWLKQALPEAIKEAETGRYRKGVIDFFKSVRTERGMRIIKEIERKI